MHSSLICYKMKINIIYKILLPSASSTKTLISGVVSTTRGINITNIGGRNIWIIYHQKLVSFKSCLNSLATYILDIFTMQTSLFPIQIKIFPIFIIWILSRSLYYVTSKPSLDWFFQTNRSSRNRWSTHYLLICCQIKVHKSGINSL